MATYVKNYSNILYVVLLFNINSVSQANPWIPQINEYQIYWSGIFIDHQSHKKYKKRKEIHAEIQNTINSLSILRDATLSAITQSGQEAYNSDIRLIEQLDSETHQLKQDQTEIQDCSDYYSISQNIEYGLYKFHSLGVKISHNSFNVLSSGHRKSSQAAYIYHKYNFFNYNNILATAQYGLSQSNLVKNCHDNFIDLSLLLGKSTHKKKQKYYSMSATVRQFMHTNIKQDIGFMLSYSQGVEIKKGIFLDNYTEYQYTKSSNKSYNNILYVQSSLTKKINIPKLKRHINLQIGYYWKTNFANSNSQLSGPILSAWLAI
ncbi:MAG: hypothetical protein DGJ47_001174 [Rickettsiaceae bacterium]